MVISNFVAVLQGLQERSRVMCACGGLKDFQSRGVPCLQIAVESTSAWWFLRCLMTKLTSITHH